MGTGSEAQNRMVNDWLTRVDSGQLRLPSFQRGVAWDSKRVVSLLQTIIDDLPLGVALVLEVGDNEQFVSRPLESVPERPTTVTEHLLDGQQRLTALYRALHDNDPKMTYFVHFPVLDDNRQNDDDGVTIRKVSRWENTSGTRFPIWTDSPCECLNRGLIPVRLFNPMFDGVDDWGESATAGLEPGDEVDVLSEYRKALKFASDRRAQIRKLIAEKRETLKHFNLPYLRLPATTSKHTALGVFVKMNTNAKPLNAHDIIVAELEGATGKLLKDLEAELDQKLPKLKRYLQLESAVLQTSALLQNKIPSQQGFFDMDYKLFIENWGLVESGLGRALQVIESMRILDSERLPSIVPVPVIAALLAAEPDLGDRRATSDKLMRRYSWRSFFTTRYEAAAASRAFVDYRALREVLEGTGSEDSVPVFNPEQYPLPTVKELIGAGWPRRKSSLARAVLAASIYFGARDFADDTEINSENIQSREYHHVFPDKLLKDAGIDSMRALNCVLITWKTNRTIGRLDPIAYLEERAQRAPDANDIEKRLDTHLTPFSALRNAGPYSDLSDELLKSAVQSDFDAYLETRAVLVAKFMDLFCNGEQPQLNDVK